MATTYVNWKFQQKPTPEQMEALLKEVPAWYGSDKTLADYMEFVVPISGYDQETKGNVFRLYMMVAGKMKILADAHVATKMPTEDVELTWVGNMVIAQGTMTSEKFGNTVFEAATGVVGDGAKGADKSNPVENAMTSWRGRAATALCGAGIMPFAICSMEEAMVAEARSEGGERVLNPTAVTPKVQKPAESPAASTEQTGKSRGGMDFAAAQKLINGMKDKLGSDDKWQAACKKFLEENEMSVPDGSIDEAILHLSGSEFGKLNKVVASFG
jgi:hypothetical protein